MAAEQRRLSTSRQRRLRVDSVQHLLKTLWGVACDSSIARPGELLLIRRAARRASRGMRDGEPRALWDIRTIMCILQLLRVRLHVDFWTAANAVGEGGFVPPIVWALEELEAEGFMKIDGREHHTAVEARVEKVQGEDRVVISILPYGDGECAVELIMNGAGAEELGRWLTGRGRDGTGRGSMFSMGKKDA